MRRFALLALILASAACVRRPPVAVVPAPPSVGGLPPGSLKCDSLGYTQTVAIDPSNTSTLYAGSFGCGVFKSTNGGASWAAANSPITASSTVRTLAIDPSNPKVIYAGTANGVFRSADGGGSWVESSAGLTGVIGGFAISSPSIRALVLDRSSKPATIYAETQVGVFKSSNEGAQWTWVNKGIRIKLAEGGVYQNTVGALAIDPAHRKTLYAGTMDFGMGGGAVQSGVYKSSNRGKEWKIAVQGLNSTSVISLAIDPSHPKTIYAGTSDGGIFKTTNGGDRWSAVSTGIPQDASTGKYPNSIYALVVDPAHPGNVYAATAGFRNGVNSLFVSRNAGESWTASNGGLNGAVNWGLAVDPSNPATVYLATSNGVFKSTDSGATWQPTGAQ